VPAGGTLEKSPLNTGITGLDASVYRTPAAIARSVSPRDPLVPQLLLLGSLCVALNTLADVIAIFAADRLLKSDAARAARARLLTRISGFTLLGLGAWLAVARREP